MGQALSSVTGSVTGVGGRYSTTADTGYFAYYLGGSGYGLAKRVAGVFTPLGAYYAVTAATNDVWSLSMVGTTISLIVNGTTRVAVEDDTIVAAGKAALVMVFASTADANNFQLTQIQGTDATVAATPPTLSVPATGQVFQRNGIVNSTATATLKIAGTNTDAAAHSIEASYRGGAYQTIATNVAAGAAFAGTLTGQIGPTGTLIVRYVDAPTATASVASVGVGEVFLCAGQSNMSGRATNNQAVSVSGSAASVSLFGNDYAVHFPLTDPYDSTNGQLDVVSNDSSANNAVGASQGGATGSYVPILGSKVATALNCPVMFVPCALGASSISQWQPGSNHQDRSTLYGSAVFRANAVGGVRAVLWHQGETDAHDGVAQASYRASLSALAAAFRADLGAKLVPCQLQSGGSYAPQANLDAINAAVAAEWAGDANVLPGPDLSTLTVDDGFAHITSDANMAAAGNLWWQAINTAFFAGPVITSPAPAVFPPSGQVAEGVVYGPNGNDYMGTLQVTTISTGGGGLTSDQAAAIALLPGLNAKVQLLGMPAVTVQSPLAQAGGLLTLVRGDDYRATDGRAITLAFAHAPDLTGGSASLLIGSKTIPGGVLSANSVRFEPTAAQTTSLLVNGTYNGLNTAAYSPTYKVLATLADGHVVTLCTGTCKVL